VNESNVVLEVNEITQVFGGLTALKNLSLKASAGMVSGIIGPNGAGKTTLLNIISGLQKPSKGKVVVSGADVTHWLSDRLSRDAKVARTFQTAKLFPTMSVWENVLVAAGTRQSSKSAVTESTQSLIQQFNLENYASAIASGLPYGVQRRVEIARALATNPVLFLLDEPAAGLNMEDKAKLGKILLEVAKDGVAVVLVEHQMDLVRATCTNLIALDFGEVIAEGTVDEVLADPNVVRAYVGVSRGTEED
jgi:branched-chain amino acid transport system ATP-binding protein